MQINDPEVLKGLAQPLRLRLYRLLALVGPATVGMLAKRLGGADPGLVSYHLRELRRRGFIEDVPELARDRRERWWRLVPGQVGWNTRDFSTPEGRTIASTIKAQMVADDFERLRRFEQGREHWPAPWQDAAVSSTSFFQLTPAELSQLSDELHEVLARWARHGREARAAGADDDERRPVLLFLHAFPEES
jgi:DNA-binding transcriptional ArsR family regulator